MEMFHKRATNGKMGVIQGIAKVPLGAVGRLFLDASAIGPGAGRCYSF